MSNATLRGIVHLIEDTKTFGQKGFRKRTVVLEQNLGRFTNYIPLDFIGDACDSADALSVGDDITVNYRLSGRKWQRDPPFDARQKRQLVDPLDPSTMSSPKHPQTIPKTHLSKLCASEPLYL
jgi:hypothetical protein